ncbi:hypothetical protein [Muriicola sp. Z0-33]|uniref:hypothetical protein n=1 Tax=Muriicola sp. Z0-33 TaxID=2816957 RepID=UPI002237FC78|nr:hypothetical protein [Muriicola sp. Z0-33]MCW5516927.1 hypothetical protein [Muriicola sp. Z0-33]
MTTREYQNIIVPLLQNKLPELEVVPEWTAFRGYSNQYSPRVDIAVGPFSTIAGNNQMNVYNRLIRKLHIRNFLKSIYDLHILNIGEEINNEIKILPFNRVLSKNQNARCFLSIEVENKNSKKHFIGSLINAASLGRIGIGVAYNDTALRTFIRIMNYLGFLKRVEKNTYDTGNFLLVTKDQFSNLLGHNLD